MNCILHISTDEKFIDMAYAQFERVRPGCNKWVVLSSESKLTYVKASVDKVVSVYQLVDYARKSRCKAIIFHSLPYSFLPVIKKIDKRVRIAWVGWGYDYYVRLLIAKYPNGLLLPETLKMKHAEQTIQISRKGRMYLAGKRLINRLIGYDVPFDYKTINKINYFSPVIDTEYQLVCSLNPLFLASYIPWNYGTVEDDFGGYVNAELGDDFLVGNSSSYENNHVDLFQYIAEHYEFTNRMVVVPLSYGSEEYRNKVLDAGNYYFGRNFFPLVEFMDKNDYAKMLERCGYVFMGHLRQQALGNICIMMLKGARIYLHSLNPLYEWFLKQGSIIEAWDTVYDYVKKMKPLNTNERAVNKSVIISNWGRDVQDKKTEKLINSLIKMN
jgi:hypothetical protein